MRRPATAAFLLLCLTTPLHGQTLEERFRQLYTFGNCGQPLCLDVNAAIHGQHYNPNVVQGQNNLLAFFTNAVSTSVGNLPFAAATSGVTFSFESGVPVATSVSPGPIFAERAQTLGRGRFLTGANLSGISLKKIRGVDLSDLSLRFTHQNTDDPALGNPAFENDIIDVNTDLDLSLIVASVYASYGLTDRLDIGILLPFVSASLTGTSLASIDEFTPNGPHSFGTSSNQTKTASAEADGSASGIGDLGLRVKANLYQTQQVGVGLFGDVRLATGDEENFLGSGQTSVRVQGVLSGRFGDFSPHLNAGVAVRTGDNSTNSILATVGFDHPLSEFAALAIDLVSDLQIGDNPITLPEAVTFTAPSVRTVRLSEIPEEKDNLIDASLGVKFALPSDLRIVTNVLIPLSEGGVRPSFLWTLGLEKSF
jgi:hypothetical protein